MLNEKLSGSAVMSLTWRAFPLGSIQITRRRAVAPPVPAAVAQTVSPRTKLVFAVTQSGVKVETPGPVLVTVKSGGFPMIEESAGLTLPIVAFQVPAVGGTKRKNCGFCVIVPPFVWFNDESIQFM